MQAVRQYYENAPSAIAIPEAMRHRKLVVIMQVQEPGWNEPKADLKSLLLAMPNVGEDADFARLLDDGREGVTWDT